VKRILSHNVVHCPVKCLQFARFNLFLNSKITDLFFLKRKMVVTNYLGKRQINTTSTVEMFQICPQLQPRTPYIDAQYKPD
jgi:hypothetical protein